MNTTNLLRLVLLAAIWDGSFLFTRMRALVTDVVLSLRRAQTVPCQAR